MQQPFTPANYEVDLYKLSQAPEFGSIYVLLQRVMNEYHKDLPKKAEDVTAFETSCYVQRTIQAVVKALETEIEVGRNLSNQDDPGGDTDGEDRRPVRRRA